MAHVASVRVDSRLLFADVFIETTGGTGGIRCRGHRKSDADRMKQQIERYQSEYYRSERRSRRSPADRRAAARGGQRHPILVSALRILHASRGRTDASFAGTRRAESRTYLARLRRLFAGARQWQGRCVLLDDCAPSAGVSAAQRRKAPSP